MKTVQLPVSKSLYIRKLFADFLYKQYFDAVPDDFPADVRVTYDCLTTISKAENSDGWVEINARYCGAAYRFLMAVLSVTPGSWLLTGTERLLQRPMEELADCLIAIGADIQRVKNGWQIRGKQLAAKELTIDCSRSSQFASALLLIGDKVGLENLNVIPENPPSEPYIYMTMKILEDPDWVKRDSSDWSAAVYWYARLLLEGEGEYLLSGLSLESCQQDKVVVRWFAPMGIRSVQQPEGVLISVEKPLSQFSASWDVSRHLDTVPVLACMASMLPGRFVFKGVNNLIYKESNRLAVIQEQLSRFADMEVGDDQLVIKKKSLPVVAEKLFFNPYKDHRFVMGFSLFALHYEVEIMDADCVAKSYPDFHRQSVVGGVNVIG